MNKNHFYTSFGIWLAILPFFGIPGAWKEVLIFASGVFLILVSLGPTIFKKLQSKPIKPRKVVSKKIINEGELKFSTKVASPQENIEDEIEKLEQ